MRISEYTRALNQLDERQLDKVFAEHTKDSVVFQPALAPPEKWKRTRGSMHGSPERSSSENASSDHSRRNIDIKRFGGPPLASRLFLAGFVMDLAQEFGENITADCINAHRLGNDTPITARTVKEIISEASQARMRQINDGHLRVFFAPLLKFEWVRWRDGSIPRQGVKGGRSPAKRTLDALDREVR